MKLLVKMLCLVGFIAFSNLLSAQRSADKTLTFESKVTDLVVVPFNGLAVISDRTALHGYDPEKGSVVWTAEIPKRKAGAVAAELLSEGLDANSLLSANSKANGPDFTVIPDTPFLQKFFDQRLFVINSFDGEMLFEGDDTAFYFQSEYLFDEDAILLRGVNAENQLVISKYSLKDKDMVWTTPVSEDFRSFMGSFISLVGSSNELSDSMTYTSDKIFVLAKSRAYVLNKEDGALLWKAEEGKYRDLFHSRKGDKVLLVERAGGILSGKSYVELRNAADGSAIWEKPLKTKNVVLYEDWEDKMLLAHYRGFNFYDYASGNKLWKKDPKGNGIKAVIPIDKDFLYVYDDEMMLLDKDGQKKWRNDVTISDNDEDPIFFLEKTNNGRVLYVTATYANLVDYNTGKRIWGSNLKLNDKRPTFAKFDEQTGDFVIYNDEKLYRFNETSEKRPKPFAKLRLKKEKLITSMEIFPENITITGQSEVIAIDKAGNVVFHNKYKQPGELGRRFLKAGIGVVKFGASAATATVTIQTQYRDADGNIVTSSTGPVGVFGEKAKAIGEAGYLASGFSQQFVQDRYNALQETDEYALIFAKQPETGEKTLVRVDKKTGEEVDRLIFANNKPVYDYDAYSKDIYYSLDNEVQIFNGK